MAGFVRNLNSLSRNLAKFEENFTKRYSLKIKKLVFFSHGFILIRTPVFTGQTIRNFIWTENRAYSGPVLGFLGEAPSDPTNQLPLGSEPNRANNAASSTATREALSFDNPFKNFILTNLSPAVVGLERGELPPDPKQQRSPRGMIRVTANDAITALRAGTFG